RFANIRKELPPQINLGTLLRWSAALTEMRDYYAVPGSFREFALGQFAQTVPQIIAAEPCLELMPLPEEEPATLDNEEFATRTIFPFFIRRRGERLSHAEAAILYRALNDDVAALLPATLPPMLRLLAARRCHIGQPVAVPDGMGGFLGALRLRILEPGSARRARESLRRVRPAARDHREARASGPVLRLHRTRLRRGPNPD